MKIINDRIHTQLNSVLNSSRTYLQDAVITMRDGRYCLPVKAEHKSRFPVWSTPVCHRLHRIYRAYGGHPSEQ